MRTTTALLLLFWCAPFAWADKTLDGTGADPAFFAWDAATATATLLVDLNESILITASGVTLDGQDHLVSGPGPIGVHVSAGVCDVTIRKLRVHGFSRGIYLDTGACRCTIESNVVTGCSTYGIELVSGNHDNRIRENEVTGIGDPATRRVYPKGISLTLANRNVVESNVTSDNAIGIYLEIGSHNHVRENVSHHNTSTDTYRWGGAGAGVLLNSVKDCVIADNTVTDNRPNGLGLFHHSNSANNTVSGNTALRNRMGLILMGADTIVENNTSEDNAGSGLIYERGPRVVIRDNRIAHNRDADGRGAVALSEPRDFVVSRNTIVENDGRALAASNIGSWNVLYEENIIQGSAAQAIVWLHGEDGIVRSNKIQGRLSVDGLRWVLEDNEFLGSGVRLVDARVNSSKVLGNELAGGTLFVGGDQNLVRGNTVASPGLGLELFRLTSSTVTGNLVRADELALKVGIYCSDDSIHDNFFMGNELATVDPTAVDLRWNIDAAPGPNIVGGPWIGGNFWGTPSGTGHSQTCADGDGDGFCDEPFVIDATNADALPLVLNSAPSCSASGSGCYEIGNPVTLGGTVADPDGDLLTYEWREGITVLAGGTIQAEPGGAPVVLPDFTLAGPDLGVHVIELRVDDGHVLDPSVCEVLVEVKDTTAPTLAPVPDFSMLWPPQHQMVTCTIVANAADNSGTVPILTVTVTSNEADEGLGDGDMPGDIGDVRVDAATGTITVDLRAERSGTGTGRTYTVTITAKDAQGNESMTSLAIVVPHSAGLGGS